MVALATSAAVAAAKDVACVVDGTAVSTVDLDTGDCQFPIPDSLPVSFEYTSPEEYKTDFYYTIAQNFRYFNDIVNAGRIISVPAKSLYGSDAAPLYHVHAEKSPASNSTLKRRLDAYKRDGASDLADSLKTLDGTPVDGHKFQVLDISSASGSSVTAAPATSTATETNTLIVTITSCSDNKCSETVVPGKETVTTVTVNDEVTSYTTVCPLTEEATSTKIVTSTSCNEDKGVETAVPGKETLTTVTVNGEVTSYTTVCPLTEEGTSTEVEGTSTVFVTVTSCADNKCSETVVPGKETLTTVTVNGEVTAYTTVCPVSEEKESTVYVTVTSCEGNKCATSIIPSTVAPVTVPTGFTNSSTPATAAPATETPTTLAPATVAPSTGAPATKAPATSAPGTSAPATKAPATEAPEQDTTSTVIATVHQSSAAAEASSVSTYEAAAAGMSKSFLALALIPLVGLF